MGALYFKYNPELIRTKGQLDEHLICSIYRWFERHGARAPITGGWFNMLAAHDVTISAFKLERNRHKMLDVLKLMRAIRSKKAKLGIHARSAAGRRAVAAIRAAMKDQP